MTASLGSISYRNVAGASALSSWAAPAAAELADGSFRHAALLAWESGNMDETGFVMLSCEWSPTAAGGLPSSCLLGVGGIQGSAHQG